MIIDYCQAKDIHIAETGGETIPLQALLKKGRTYPLFKGYISNNFLALDNYTKKQYQNKTAIKNSITHVIYINNEPSISLTTCPNQWLSNHYGFPIGNLHYAITNNSTSQKNITRLFMTHLAAAKSHFNLIITTLPAEEITLNKAALQNGFNLMTTRERYLISREEYEPVALRHRALPYDQGHDEKIKQLLSETSFPSHFSNDPRLDKDKTNEMYAEWMLKETNKTMKSVIYRSENLVGAASIQLDLHSNTKGLPSTYKSSLIATKFGHLGVAYSLVAYGLNKGLEIADYAEFIVSHEVTALTRILKKLGMQYTGTENVLHFWAN